MFKICPKFIFSNTDLNHIQSHETLKNEREVYFMEVIFYLCNWEKILPKIVKNFSTYTFYCSLFVQEYKKQFMVRPPVFS